MAVTYFALFGAFRHDRPAHVPEEEAQDSEGPGKAMRSKRWPPLPSSLRTLAARIQAVHPASNMRAVILTVIEIQTASTAKRLPKRLVVQGHVAPLERACHRLHHASLTGAATAHSTSTKGSRLVTQTRVIM